MPGDRLQFEPRASLPAREHFVIRYAHVVSVDSASATWRTPTSMFGMDRS